MTFSGAFPLQLSTRKHPLHRCPHHSPAAIPHSPKRNGAPPFPPPRRRTPGPKEHHLPRGSTPTGVGTVPVACRRARGSKNVGHTGTRAPPEKQPPHSPGTTNHPEPERHPPPHAQRLTAGGPAARTGQRATPRRTGGALLTKPGQGLPVRQRADPGLLCAVGSRGSGCLPGRRGTAARRVDRRGDPGDSGDHAPWNPPCAWNPSCALRDPRPCPRTHAPPATFDTRLAPSGIRRGAPAGLEPAYTAAT